MGLPSSMNRLLDAIEEDEQEVVAALLKSDPGLVAKQVTAARLYRGKIQHWLYVGDTALHLAAAGYRVGIVQSLVAAGADPNAATNHRHSTPLHYAADGYVTGPAWDARRQVETIRALLAAGADINVHDKNGATPLHRAVRTRCAAAVKCLLKAGADPKLRNKPGSTPFHLAVQNSGRGGSGAAIAIAAQKQIIKEFLSAGLSVELKSSNGKSVRDWARSAWIRELLDA